MASERLPCQILTSAPLFSCKVTQDLELYIYPFNQSTRCAIENSRNVSTHFGKNLVKAVAAQPGVQGVQLHPQLLEIVT